MQAFLENDIVEKVQGSKRELEKRGKELMDSDKADRVAIGNLPQVNERYIINGLLFRVTNVMPRGRIQMKLEGPAPKH